MVPMTFIWWIYHFWARFWPYFNFVDFRAYFGPFSLVNRDRQKMADLLMKMASNQKMQENKPTLKFNFTIEKRWPVSIFELFGPQHLSHWALPTIIGAHHWCQPLLVPTRAECTKCNLGQWHASDVQTGTDAQNALAIGMPQELSNAFCF